MVREQGPFNLNNRWSRIAWGSIAVVCIVSFLLGFLVLGRFQQNGPTLGAWDAFCRALGITADSQPSNAPQPPRRTPTRIAWTRDTLTRIESGNEQRGAFVALNCDACHGDYGVSASALIPTLAGQNSAVLYKQLDDYRSNKRQWGVMGAIATALTDQDSADVARYFARRPDGLAPIPVIRLVFAGDPGRGIPPCAACHGPGAEKLGAPALHGQHTAYIERQLAAFAQGMRQNDINEQMRVIARELTPDEMHGVAVYYGAAAVRE